jgi:hypothetical protein
MNAIRSLLNVNSGKVDSWCCQPTDYGQPCSYPADYLVITGDSPDDTTLMCRGHVSEVWEPYWRTVPLSDGERTEYAILWEDWISGKQLHKAND